MRFCHVRLEIREGGRTQAPVGNGYENFFYVFQGK